MLPQFWKSLCRLGTGIACGAALLAVAGQAPGQEALPNLSPPVQKDDDLKARIERLEKQNQDLLSALQNLQRQQSQRPTLGLPVSTAIETQEGAVSRDQVKSIVSDYLKSQKAEDDAKKKEQADKGFVVGKNLDMSARWTGNQYWIESADKAFRLHFGGRTQYDAAWVDAADITKFGSGGIGAYDNGSNFRRARFAFEGTFWEVFDFNCEYDFINTTQALGSVTGVKDAAGNITALTTTNNTFNTPVPTDLWITLTHLPWIGNLRVGNQKPFYGFEHMVSSRFLNFMERSPQFDAFIEEGNNGFSPGVSIFNTFGPEDNGTWGVGAFKTTRAIFGWNTGNDELKGTARATWLPIYQDEGRYLLHVGLGGAYGRLDDNIARFRARTMLRQAPAALHNIVAIGRVNGQDQALINPELVANIGPLTIQSEYTGSWVYGVTNITNTPTQVGQKVSNRTYFAQGFYVEALYFLTGEHRDYSKKSGAFGRVIPKRNFFWVPGEHGGNLFSQGAWQVGARYAYLDLNNNGVDGGQINDVTLGLNWFLNPNFKIQWNYEYGHRNVAGTASGDFTGFGMRFAFDW